MRRGAVRRYTRVQPRHHGPEQLSHTSPAAAAGYDVQLPAEYLDDLREDLERAQFEQELWAGAVIAQANEIRDDRLERRRQAREQAARLAEQRQQEQQRIQDERLAEQRARAAERAEQARQEAERIRQERAAEDRRRREEQEAIEEARRAAAAEAARQREAAEAARRRAAEEAERRRRERLRPCSVCMDENDVNLMVQVPCSHWYCRACLKGMKHPPWPLANSIRANSLDGIEASFASRTRFQCCQQHVPVTLVAELLPDGFIARYELMVLEQTTVNPTYCANVACGSFIPPTNYHGPDLARCDQCHRETCRHCRTRDHAGRGCTADTATDQVRALAAIVGWKTCPNCQNMVERADGCLHMSCRCGAEFCYRCGGLWSVCRGTCQGQYF